MKLPVVSFLPLPRLIGLYTIPLITTTTTNPNPISIITTITTSVILRKQPQPPPPLSLLPLPTITITTPYPCYHHHTLFLFPPLSQHLTPVNTTNTTPHYHHPYPITDNTMPF
ncbi:hypothetical protein Pmani_000273 [Petrolisthes manimaculis]|uniref:Uncharacterized protein n=1 Tax=Petrolisthes manimaculis TaxID=1843537 RepID=A0AAE1UQI3_9EUCA|nr:hypothetical protein Pmani_000273 [Petrolisthes manimaculis]